MWKQSQAEMLNPLRSRCVQGGEDTGRSAAGELESWRPVELESCESSAFSESRDSDVGGRQLWPLFILKVAGRGES